MAVAFCPPYGARTWLIIVHTESPGNAFDVEIGRAELEAAGVAGVAG